MIRALATLLAATICFGFILAAYAQIEQSPEQTGAKIALHSE